MREHIQRATCHKDARALKADEAFFRKGLHPLHLAVRIYARDRRHDMVRLTGAGTGDRDASIFGESGCGGQARSRRAGGGLKSALAAPNCV